MQHDSWKSRQLISLMQLFYFIPKHAHNIKNTERYRFAPFMKTVLPDYTDYKQCDKTVD